MLDDLDAMAAALRESQRKPARRKRPVTRIEISYWSQAEQRYKTRWTTCVFKPSG